MLHDSYLDIYGLTINKRLKAILCTHHGEALTGVARHRKSKHTESKAPTLDLEQLKAICLKHGIGDVPVIEAQREPIISYDGITVKEGFACQVCAYVAGTELSIIEHYNKEHGSGVPKSYTHCSYQQLCGKDTHKAKFRVHPKAIPEPVTPLEAVMEAMREEITLLAKPSESTVNARAISPWLLASGFHLHVETFNKTELMALVAGGLDTKTAKIRKVVRKYYFKAADLLPVTPELVKQMLNSPDPPKKYFILTR